MVALVVVTWFCSEFSISSSNFPFPSILSSRAAVYLYAPALVFVCLCQFYFILVRPIPRVALYVNTTRLSWGLCANKVHLCVNTDCALSNSVCNSGSFDLSLYSTVVPIPLCMHVVRPHSVFSLTSLMLMSPLPSTYYASSHPSLLLKSPFTDIRYPLSCLHNSIKIKITFIRTSALRWAVYIILLRLKISFLSVNQFLCRYLMRVGQSPLLGPFLNGGLT